MGPSCFELAVIYLDACEAVLIEGSLNDGHVFRPPTGDADEVNPTGLIIRR